MSWLFLAAGVILAVEILPRVPLVLSLYTLKQGMLRALKTLTSKTLTDSEKEKLLRTDARQMLSASLVLLGSLFILMTPLITAGFLGQHLGMDVFWLLASPLGLLVSIVIAVAYIQGKKLAGRG